MTNPQYHYFPEGTQITFKKLCIEYHVKFAWVDGVKYRMPEDWEKYFKKVVDRGLLIL